MKVLYVSSEVVPFAKTGGLADVAGVLPLHVQNCGCDIRVVTPLYRTTQKQDFDLDPLGPEFKLQIGLKTYAGLFFKSTLKQSVPIYFIQCDELYDRDGLYGDQYGDYVDNAERFIYFCRAVLDLCRHIDFVPDIIHCNDWQTGLIPAYLKAGIGTGFFATSAIVFTIHNIAYQGLFDLSKFELTGLPHWFYDIRGLEYWGQMSMLKAGIVFSRTITTVSRKYAREILTPEYGCGLEGILQDRQTDLYGVLNGVDYDEWNPGTDRLIKSAYTALTLRRKQTCKKDLLVQCGLPESRIKPPLIGSISRLVDQKGFDLIAATLDGLLDLGATYILLGSGDTSYERLFKKLAARNKNRMSFCCAYDNQLAHKIEAGSDMFLMPSRYEPCGLNQIYSLKYGTVPIVHATGGLDDTIIDYTAHGPDTGNGFKFQEYTADALFAAAQQAVALYKEASRWRQLMLNGMSCSFSWAKSAEDYCRLYAKTRYPGAVTH
jgi:starch synthase